MARPAAGAGAASSGRSSVRSCVEPRRDRRSAAKVLQRPRCRDERLLKHFLRIVVAATHAFPEPEDAALVAVEQPFERGMVTVARCGHELFVSRTHRASWVRASLRPEGSTATLLGILASSREPVAALSALIACDEDIDAHELLRRSRHAGGDRGRRTRPRRRAALDRGRRPERLRSTPRCAPLAHRRPRRAPTPTRRATARCRRSAWP